MRLGRSAILRVSSSNPGRTGFLTGALRAVGAGRPGRGRPAACTGPSAGLIGRAEALQAAETSTRMLPRVACE